MEAFKKDAGINLEDADIKYRNFDTESAKLLDAPVPGTETNGTKEKVLE